MNVATSPAGEVRKAHSLTYQQLLDTDTRTAPDILRIDEPGRQELLPIPAKRYYDAAFYQQEVEKVWLKTWQYAVREEEIPNPGDTYVFDLVGRSVLIVRQDDGSVKAFRNICRHRGRRLVGQGGMRRGFRCAYHGFSWNTDGSFKSCPLDWDFPQIDQADFGLFGVRLDSWAGFIFVNFDPDAKPLLEILQPLPEHFQRWNMDDCYKTAHVAKVMPANWKACVEAFIEASHVASTHPQVAPYIADANSQCDLLSSHVDRFLTPVGQPSPQIDADSLDQLQILTHMLTTGSRAGMNEVSIELEDGVTARQRAAELSRARLEQATGYDYQHFADAEVLDGISYHLFPNVSIWGGAGTKTFYRWRPWNDSPDETLMEVFLFARNPKGGKGETATLRMLGPDETWASATELGFLAGVYDQDQSNMAPQRAGLKDLGEDGVIHFGRYTELRCRHLHEMIDQYIAR